MPDRDTLMRQVMEMQFAAHEINLYMDTHPTDTRMLPYYTQYNNEYETLKAQYESLYGPISVSSGVQNNQWAWIDDPWPWE